MVRSPDRLAAVHAAALLDAPAEEDFDELTRLARATLGAAASFVSIVDADRDFYKSQSGFPEPLASARELSGRTFCHFAIASPRALVIDDTWSQPLWKAVPTVASLGVRAYVGVPIVFDGQPIGSFCVIDVHPRAWSPAEVEIVVQLSRSAGREIRLRAALAAVEAEAAQSRAAMRRGEELMAVIAHDLRSPLQAVSLTASMLGRSDDAVVREHAGRIALASSSMRSLVDGLAASGADGAELPQPRPIAVSSLLDDAVRTMAPIAGRAGVAVGLGPLDDATVHVDYAQILRALCNVLGNAIKYGPGSSVTLSATRSDDRIRLAITDDGPGIAAADLGRVFERGFQAANGAKLGQGDGLGLSIVRALVERNGGTADIDSTEGVGTTVRIALPC